MKVKKVKLSQPTSKNSIPTIMNQPTPLYFYSKSYLGLDILEKTNNL